MTSRREINPLHEASVIEAGVRAHNLYANGSFYIESRPNPPDAILFDGKKRLWLEHTDAFYPGWAEHLTSYAASDKKHRSVKKGGHMDMDNIFADVFVEVVLNKIKKTTYVPFIEEFGPGILIVGLESPWLDDETLAAIDKKWKESGCSQASKAFQYFYLGYRVDGKNAAIPWIPIS